MINKYKTLLACLLLGLAALPAFPKETLRVVSWSGTYVKSQILGFIRPFEEATGVNVEVIQYSGGIREIRSQVRSYNVKWDVVDLELFDAIRACREGLLVELDPASLPPAPDGTPASEDFLSESLRACGVGSVLWSTVVAYDQSRFEKNPRTIKDFFDVKNFPGPRALRHTPKTNLEWALIADGVPRDRVYDVLETDEGLNRAFKMLNRIKPVTIWWETVDDAIRWLENGKVAMASIYSGHVPDVVERGTPLNILWDNQILYLDVWGIPKNGKNIELAKKFVQFATSPQSLANQTQYIPYGPARRSSMELIPEERHAQLPTAQKNIEKAFESDPQWWAENLETIRERFERWLGRPIMVPRKLPH